MTPEAAQLRSDIGVLTDSASRDLAGLWQRITTAVAAREALFEVLPHIVEQYGAAAGTIAATWYDQLRAKQGVPGTFYADPAPATNLGADALVGWASATSTNVVQDGVVTPSFRSLLEGGMQRRIANVARTTVMGASVRDPRSEGWMRVGNGTCSFCSMLIGRGAVYRSESSAEFRSHDHCQCSAMPVWR